MFKFDLQLFGGLFDGGGGGGGSTPEVKAPVSSAPASVATTGVDEATKESRKKIRRRVFDRASTNVSGNSLMSGAASMAKKLLGE